MIPCGNVSDRPDIVEIECEIVAITDQAVLVEIDTYGECWIPKSQIEGGHCLDEGDLHECASLHVAQWFARQKGIE